jgi:hypothetical protein
MLFLPWNRSRQLAELIEGALDLPPRLAALPAIHLQSGVSRPPAGPLRNRHHHVQITQQLSGRCGRRLRLGLPPCFQKQLGLFQKPLPDYRPAVSPSGVQLTGLPGIESAPGEGVGQPLAVLQADLRHRRQKLRRHVGRDLPGPHLLLHAFGKLFDQRQPARHPTDAAIEAPRQLIQPVSEALLEFGQQPAFFQRRLAFGQVDRTVQHHSVGLGHRPHYCLDRVAPQLLERRDALVAVDDQIAVRLAGHCHHHDRRLLSRCRQRR